MLAALQHPEVVLHNENDGTIKVDIPLPLPPETVRDSVVYQTLRAVARGEIRVRPVR